MSGLAASNAATSASAVATVSGVVVDQIGQRDVLRADGAGERGRQGQSRGGRDERRACVVQNVIVVLPFEPVCRR